MQLTIYHQLIGLPCEMLNATGVVVGVTEINGQPLAMVHKCFELAKPSPFHKRKHVYSIMHEVNDLKLLK